MISWTFMLGDLLQGVQSLLLPTSCAGCGAALFQKANSPLCGFCLSAFCPLEPPWVCQKKRFSFDLAISPCAYEGTVRTLLTKLKYQGRLSVAPFLGTLIARAVGGRLGADPPGGIVPVPLHPTRLRERGFNQALLLAEILSKELHLPCHKDLLKRPRPTRPQTQLTRQERRRNVRGAFSLGQPHPLIRRAHLLLVDDIFTTGATADQCATVLKEAGAQRVTVVTVAHG